MNLKEIIFYLKVHNLVVHKGKYEDIPCDYFLQTKDGELIALGWNVDDNLDEEGYFFSAELNLLHRSKARLSNKQQGDEFERWDGFLFALNNNYIWHCPLNVLFPDGTRGSDFIQFAKDMKNHFPQLKTEGERIIDAMIKYEEKYQNLEDSLKLAHGVNEQLLKDMREIGKENAEMKRKIDSYVHELRVQKHLLEQHTMNCAYLSNLQKSSILKQITRVQARVLKEIMELKHPECEIKSTSVLTSIGVNHDFYFPGLLVRIPSTEMVAWDTSHDYISFPVCKYCIIQPNGTIEKISVDEIGKNDNACFKNIGVSESYLLGCTIINLEDL